MLSFVVTYGPVVLFAGVMLGVYLQRRARERRYEAPFSLDHDASIIRLLGELGALLIGNSILQFLSAHSSAYFIFRRTILFTLSSSNKTE